MLIGNMEKPGVLQFRKKKGKNGVLKISKKKH